MEIAANPELCISNSLVSCRPLNDRKLLVIINVAHAGQRLDQALAMLTGLSRNHIQKLMHDHAIRTAGKTMCRTSTKAKVGQKFTVHLPKAVPLNIIPEDIPLDVLFEDEYLLVINKPAGMVVHPGHGHDNGTLVNALLFHCSSLPGINGVERPGIVHRLDKDTSGSLVIAKTEKAHRGLTDIFSMHNLDRQYIAWCRGVPAWYTRRIDEPIGRHPRHRKKMSVRSDGKPAVTEATVERRYDKHFCRIRLTLHTGRTHQIRVHLSHAGLPILEDTTYGRSYHPPRDVPASACTAIKRLHRQALHAEILRFIHPVTREQISCAAPLPADLKVLSATLDDSYE